MTVGTSTNTDDLAGQVALITGASRGLGRAIAIELAGRGARVACVARAGDELDRTVAELPAPGEGFAAPADVTRAAKVEAAVAATIARWGRLDVVVLNAGTWLSSPIHEMAEDDWDSLLALNLKGAFLTLKYAVPHLIARRGGTIVGISSLGGWVGQANGAAYAASKWGLRGLLESVALELKPQRVRVSIVSPHNIHHGAGAPAAGSPERDRTIESEEIASLIGWICAAPQHVAVGNVTIWPLAAGVTAG